MSYILEALKKSDKDRKREEIPDLRSDHSLSSPRRKKRQILVFRRSVVLIVLSLGLAALGWLQFSGSQQEELAEKPDRVTPPVALPAPALVPEKAVVITPELKVQIDKEVAEVMSRIVSAPEPEQAQGAVEVAVLPLIEDLPSELKAAIPDLSFAGHVYAAESRQRMVMINMRVVREGDMVSSDLVLVEIVEDGVVLRYNDVVFRVNLF